MTDSGRLTGSREPDPSSTGSGPPGFDPGRKVAAKLADARALIEHGWTQAAFARDATGDRVYTHSADAVSYCAIGAIIHASDPRGSNANYEILRAAYRALEAAIHCGSTDEIEDWNDSPKRTHAEVLAAFDKAIELARGDA